MGNHIDYSDPYLALLRSRGEFMESDEDELLSFYAAASARAKNYEAERYVARDVLGASPNEIRALLHKN